MSGVVSCQFWIWLVLMTAARTVGGLDYPEMIEEMDGELTKVIGEFDRAVDVEALRLAKKNGASFSHSGRSMFTIVSRRARVFARAAQISRDQLSPGFPLYGRHPPGTPRRNHNLGDQ